MSCSSSFVVRNLHEKIYLDTVQRDPNLVNTSYHYLNMIVTSSHPRSIGEGNPRLLSQNWNHQSVPAPAEDAPPERVLAGKNQRERFADLAAKLSESRPEACEAVASDRQHPVHRRFELELPSS